MCFKALDLFLKLTEKLRRANQTENSEGRAFYPDSLPRILFGREIGVALPSSVAQASLPVAVQPPTMNPEPGTMNHSPIPITPPLHHSRSPGPPEASFGARNALPQCVGDRLRSANELQRVSGQFGAGPSGHPGRKQHVLHHSITPGPTTHSPAFKSFTSSESA